MTNTVIELVKAQKFFYRDNYRKALKVLFFCQFLILVLVIVNFYFATHRTIPGFYASSSDGFITPLKSLDKPTFTRAELAGLGG